MVDRNVRAGDAERDRVADSLRRHAAEGRLTPEEFDERLSAAFSARTVGDLADLVIDLPQDPDGYALPVPVSGNGSSRVSHRSSRHSLAPVPRAHLALYVTVSVICVLIAILSRTGTWPIWVIGPWGIVLLSQATRGKGVHGPLDGRRRDRHRGG